MTTNHAKEIQRKKRLETSLKNSEELFAIKPNTSFLEHDSSLALSKNVLRNVVLTFVDTTGKIRDEFWNHFEKTHSFPVHGYFEIDNQEGNGPIKIQLNEFLGISGRKEDECECQQTLRSRVSELLIWARRVKDMTTSVLSSINFSIPFVSDIEGTVDIAKEDESNKNFSNEVKRVYRSESLQNDSLRSLDSQEGNYTDLEKYYRKDVSNNGNIWDVFDLFSKIKTALFRAMIDSLNGSTNKMDDEFSFQESSSLPTNYIDLVDGTMKNLKILSGVKGYMLVLVIPGNELTSVMDLLHYQISPSDTLVVVTELCSKDIKHAPFFADGPEASTLDRIRTIKELADIIKSLLSRSCQKQDCRNANQHFHDIPIRIARDTNGSQFTENVNTIMQTKSSRY
ncbi:uncharacterized protein LOC122519256 [Polistes fuscatus]|uniref:uncharacterized protein LOC122519256 n=1 Tax=Polistes fuscatus TaxID=30207 RepID=UPI001CA8049A|nr:uncharacterized protein LOC122519256 [Polistes fuscatus]